MNQKQMIAFRALARALVQATDEGVLDELAAYTHPDNINRFADAFAAMREATPPAGDTALKPWTVVHGDAGQMFTCQAEDIAHAIEQCENANPNDAIQGAFEGLLVSSVEVEHWDANRYGGQTTETEPFTFAVRDMRRSNGQLDIDLCPADRFNDDGLYARIEVNRLEGSKDDEPCLHLHFDSDNLAMSIFRQGSDCYIVRPENGVSVRNTTLPTGETALIVG